MSRSICKLYAEVEPEYKEEVLQIASIAENAIAGIDECLLNEGERVTVYGSDQGPSVITELGEEVGTNDSELATWYSDLLEEEVNLLLPKGFVAYYEDNSLWVEHLEEG